MPPRDSDDADIVPFPNLAPRPPRGTAAVAVVVAIVSGVVELAKFAMLLAVVVLAGYGLATLLR
jgi:hypothetical protein